MKRTPLDRYLTTDPYEYGPADVGTDRPEIDLPAQDAAQRNETATRNHQRADALAAHLRRADPETLADLRNSIILGHYRTVAEILVDIIDGIS